MPRRQAVEGSGVPDRERSMGWLRSSCPARATESGGGCSGGTRTRARRSNCSGRCGTRCTGLARCRAQSGRSRKAVEAHLSARPASDQDAWAARLVVEGLGAFRLTDLTVAHCDDFLRSAAAGMNGRRPIGLDQLRKVRQFLAAVLRNEMRVGNLARNVGDLSRLPPVQSSAGERRALDRAELRALLSRARGSRLIIVDLIGRNGLRPAEARGLLWSDLDLNASLLSVSGQLDRQNRRTSPKTKKGVPGGFRTGMGRVPGRKGWQWFGESILKEFKEQAVRRVIDGSRPVVDVAQELGVHEGTLSNWVRRHRDEHPVEEKPLTQSERVRLAELKRENRELRAKAEFLVKRQLSSPRSIGELEVRVHRWRESELSPAINVSLAWRVTFRFL